jgi:SAM-dependent methyltransferase
VANREMVELWNGPVSEAWVLMPERYDGMLDPLGRLALDAAALRPGDRVLDVGCGSGQLSLQAADRVAPDGRVLGVDVSAPLVALARRRAAGREHVRFLECDAQEADVAHDAHDVVVSRFGVMFFDDPVTAFANLRAAVAPGGRLAFVCWQSALRNEWVMTAMSALLPHVGLPELPEAGAPGPFAFDDPEHVRSVVEQAGWCDIAIEGVETTLLVGGPGSLDEAMAFYAQDVFGRRMLAGGDPAQREAALAALRDAAATRMSDEGLRLGTAVWVVTARRP